MIGCGAMALTYSGLRAGGRQAQEDVRAHQRLFQRARRGIDGVRAFPLVHAVGAAAPDRARTVAHDDVVVAHAHRLDQRGAGDRRRARAVDHDFHVLEIAPGQMAGVDRPAAVMIAVPCWSSCITGIFRRSRSACSMMKHSGALMSSRLMPPKLGSSSATASMKASGSSVATSMSIDRRRRSA
jgi:hypothetical protein